MIDTLQNQMKEKSLEVEGTEAGVDGEGVNLSDDAGSDSMEVELHEESDGMDEKFNIVAENKENCDVNAEILKAGKNDKDIVKPSNDTKARRVSKRKKASSGDGMLLTKSPVKPDAVAGDIEVGSAKAEVPGDTEHHETAKPAKPKRKYVRKKAEAH